MDLKMFFVLFRFDASLESLPVDDSSLVQVVEGGEDVAEDQSYDDLREAPGKEILDRFLARPEAEERVDDVDFQVLHEGRLDGDDVLVLQLLQQLNFSANGFELVVAVIVSGDPLERHILRRRLVQREEDAFAKSRFYLIVKHLVLQSRRGSTIKTMESSSN